MPTLASFSSSSSGSSRKLRVSVAEPEAAGHMDRYDTIDDENQQQRLQDEEKEWREMEDAAAEREGGGDDASANAKMVIDCEASCSSSSGSSSSHHSANARTHSSTLSSRLVLLQYPSSSSSSSSSSHSSHSSSYAYTDSGNQPQQLALLPPVPSDVARVQTPLLFPVAVVPQQVPRATEIQLFLSRIEYIEINSVIEREEGVVYYVLDVFRHRQQNGIPTRRRSSAPPPYQPQQQQQQQQVLVDVSNLNTKHNNLQQLQRSGSSQAREPDYQIEHRYSSFARLRSNVWQIARKRHRRGRACTYCGSLAKFFVESDAQPNLKVKFTTTTEKRKEILSKFINNLLFVTRDDHMECARSLRGFHQVPVLMKRFLNEQTGENFFS